VTKACDAGEEYLKLLGHGFSGAGKSTLCGTAPRPILYAYTERQGLISFKRVAPQEDTVPINSVADLRALLSELKGGGHGYATICLDSGTEMQRMIVDEIVARKERDPNEPTKVTTEEWMFIIDRTKQMVRAFRDLPLHVVVMFLSDDFVVGEGEHARQIVRPMVNGKKLPAQLAQFFNAVGFCYKGSDGSRTTYRVLFDGRADIDTKGLPGLRYREEPDIAYWVNRAIHGGAPRDPEATMLAEPLASTPDYDSPENGAEAADEPPPEEDQAQDTSEATAPEKGRQRAPRRTSRGAKGGK
jgi:hypothetical protein